MTIKLRFVTLSTTSEMYERYSEPYSDQSCLFYRRKRANAAAEASATSQSATTVSY